MTKGDRGIQTEMGMSLNAGNANQYPVLKKTENIRIIIFPDRPIEEHSSKHF